MAPTRRGRPGGGDLNDTLTATTYQSSRNNSTPRLAEDGSSQLAEAEHWLDAADLVLIDALGDESTYSLRDAAEHALTAHSRIRGYLARAVA